MALPTQVRRSNPVDTYSDVEREFENFVGRFFGGRPTTTTGRRSAPYAVDVREDADGLQFEVELPGFKKDEVNVTLEDHTLTITAERQVADKAEGSELLLHERRHTYFSRSFHLPPTVDDQQVDAKLADGVLHLGLRKKEETKPRKIEIA
jgi:HSP20 family protein